MFDTTIDSIPATIKQTFDADGFFIANQVVDPSLVQRGIAHMDAVIAGDYETGIPPLDLTKLATAEQLEHLRSNPNSTKICKIDQAHFCDETIRRLVSDPAIGRLSAAATGARWIQVWGTQLLLKPAGDGGSANVGWHQDLFYWQAVWEGEVFTAWLALSDLTSDPDEVCSRFA